MKCRACLMWRNKLDDMIDVYHAYCWAFSRGILTEEGFVAVMRELWRDRINLETIGLRDCPQQNECLLVGAFRG